MKKPNRFFKTDRSYKARRTAPKKLSKQEMRRLSDQARRQRRTP